MMGVHPETAATGPAAVTVDRKLSTIDRLPTTIASNAVTANGNVVTVDSRTGPDATDQSLTI